MRIIRTSQTVIRNDSAAEELQTRDDATRYSVESIMATPGVGPPSYQYSPPLPVGSAPQAAAPPDASGNFMDIDRGRMDVLVKNFRGTIGVLYSERNPFYKQLASNIKGYYSTSLFFSGTEIINYDDTSWLDVSTRYTHLIFVGIPPTKKRATRKGKATSLDSSTRENELMSRANRKLSTVVVIIPAVSRSKPDRKGHFLERFFHIPLNHPSDLTRLAQTAFAVFSGIVVWGVYSLCSQLCVCVCKYSDLYHVYRVYMYLVMLASFPSLPLGEGKGLGTRLLVMCTCVSSRFREGAFSKLCMYSRATPGQRSYLQYMYGAHTCTFMHACMVCVCVCVCVYM